MVADLSLEDQYNDYGLSNLRLVEKSGAGQISSTFSVFFIFAES
jgi:hypothetical protein